MAEAAAADPSAGKESTLDVAARDVLVGIQLAIPGIRSIFISGVNCLGAELLADRLAAVVPAALKLQVISIKPGHRDQNDRADDPEPSAARWADVPYVRETIREAASVGFVIASGEDFLASHDNRVLAAAVDGVVLVVGRDRTRGRDLREARALLDTLSATLLGAVVANGRLT
jgi:hypothetical protein